MELITTDKIRRVFYKGNSDKPDWESFYTIEEITQKVTGKRLPSKTDKEKTFYLVSNVRARLYPIMDQELKQQGRFIAAVKRPREEVVYGFTRERDKILNYVARRVKRDKNIANNTEQINSMANTLMEYLGKDKIDSTSIENEAQMLLIESGYKV